MHFEGIAFTFGGRHLFSLGATSRALGSIFRPVRQLQAGGESRGESRSCGVHGVLGGGWLGSGANTAKELLPSPALFEGFRWTGRVAVLFRMGGESS